MCIRDRLYSVPYFKEKLDVTDIDINFYLDSLSKLNSSKTSYLTFAKFIVTLCRHVGMPENGSELKGPLHTFPKFGEQQIFSIYWRSECANI